jgi:predicted enzyme related to lactoylglutathione lyase
VEDLMAEASRNRHLAAVGIVVQDLVKSIDFYISIIGMQEAQRIDVPDKSLVEVVLTFPGSRGAAVLLMKFDDGEDRAYRDDGGKVVLQVGDCIGVTEAARAAGYTVTREPGDYPGFGTIAMVTDPDGRTVELIGAPAGG